MTGKVKNFVLGVMLGLFGNGIGEPGEDANFVFHPQTGLLIVNRDDGSLSYAFSESDFSLKVTEV